MAGVREFQEKLLTDPETRRRFAEDPQGTLGALGISLPANTKLPDRIDPLELEKGVSQINEALQEQGTSLDQIDYSSTPSVTRLVEDAVPLRTRDLRYMEAVHDEFATEAMTAGRNPGEVATIAVVGAVVAAVVAVPVAVYGITEDIQRVVNPALGIERVGSRARGLTVFGPQGVRIEGAQVSDVAALIERLRESPQ